MSKADTVKTETYDHHTLTLTTGGLWCVETNEGQHLFTGSESRARKMLAQLERHAKTLKEKQ